MEKVGGRFLQELRGKVHKLGLHCIEVSSYDCCHQMSDFKAKMHQIRFRLGLRPRPRWGSLPLPRPLAGFKGRYNRGGMRGEEGARRGERGLAPRA